jgi:hypothetical protein
MKIFSVYLEFLVLASEYKGQIDVETMIEDSMI